MWLLLVSDQLTESSGRMNNTFEYQHWSNNAPYNPVPDRLYVI